MKLLTKAIHAKLRANAEKQLKDGEQDFKPVLKLFNPTGKGTWLITELASNEDTMFGLCDIGYPELGYVSLQELSEYRGRFNLGIERDIHWKADKTLSEYADIAREKGYIDA